MGVFVSFSHTSSASITSAIGEVARVVASEKSQIKEFGFTVKTTLFDEFKNSKQTQPKKRFEREQIVPYLNHVLFKRPIS